MFVLNNLVPASAHLYAKASRSQCQKFDFIFLEDQKQFYSFYTLSVTKKFVTDLLLRETMAAIVHKMIEIHCNCASVLTKFVAKQNAHET